MTHPRSGPKIGVLVPFTNTNLEPDMATLCPPGCTMHFARMGGYDVEELPGADQMAGLGASDISETLRLLCGVRPAAVLYGCTSATLTHGRAFDEELAQKIRNLSGAVCITAAQALVGALKALGASRVGFASPYIGEVNDAAVSFLRSESIETLRVHDVGRELGNYGQGALTPREVYALAIGADHPQAEAIVLSCTDMRSVEVLADVEAALGKPVVSSNQAMVFEMCKALSLPEPENRVGRLFDLL